MVLRRCSCSLPQLDGTVSVAGLSTPVQVVRDQQGVPHIRAHNLDDLFFAQGYVTAQDRLWQMDLSRRYAAGELSEVFGSAALSHDRQQRILGFRHLAENSVQYLSGSDKHYLEVYARGVNAYIAQQQQSKTLPLEFRIFRYRPKPWTVTDSLLVGINMAQMLNYYWVSEMLAREKVANKVGPELAAELFPKSHGVTIRPPWTLNPTVLASLTCDNWLGQPWLADGINQLGRPTRREATRDQSCRHQRTRSARDLQLSSPLLPKPVPDPTTGSSPARTPPPESRYSPTICTSKTRSLTSGMKRNSKRPASTSLE